MTDNDAVNQIVDVVEAMAIPYMIVGSLSSSYYGITRSTKDADFVVELGGHRIRDVVNALGDEYQLYSQMLFETVTGTTRHLIEIPSIPYKVDVFRLSQDEHDIERFARRQLRFLTRLDRDVFIPTAEDVIITKLRWSVAGERGKDFDDITHVIAVQGDAIDWEYVHAWADKHGTRERLEEIRAKIPPID